MMCGCASAHSLHLSHALSSAARDSLLLMYWGCAGLGGGPVQGGHDFDSIAEFMSRFGVTSMDDSADKILGVINTQVTGKGGGGLTKQAGWPQSSACTTESCSS